MKLQEKLPLPLGKIVEDLNEMGIEANVYKAKVDYDKRKIGTDVILTLDIRINDVYNERKTPEEAFDDAMSIL